MGACVDEEARHPMRGLQTARGPKTLERRKDTFKRQDFLTSYQTVVIVSRIKVNSARGPMPLCDISLLNLPGIHKLGLTR